MDRAGVDIQVLAVSPQSPWLVDADAAEAAARRVNDMYAELIARHPDRFRAYAALPLPHVEATHAELERALALPGFVGVTLSAFLPARLTAGSEGASLADPSLDEVWSALNERHAVVNIHPTGSGACSPHIRDHHLEWVNGALVEDATATLQLLKADVPGRFPNITFHVAHLGGDLPFMAQRHEDNYTDWDAFPRSPRETLSNVFFDAANFHEPSLALAAETFGISQILAGSDMPYFQDDRYVRAFDYIRTSRLSETDRKRVLSENARGLYEGRKAVSSSHPMNGDVPREHLQQHETGLTSVRPVSCCCSC